MRFEDLLRLGLESPKIGDCTTGSLLDQLGCRLQHALGIGGTALALKSAPKILVFGLVRRRSSLVHIK